MAKIKFTGPTRDADAALAAGENGYLLVVPAESAIYLLTGDDAPPPPEPPTVLSARQFWLALLDGGYMPAMTALLGQIPERDRIAIERATEFDRTFPQFVALAGNIGTSEQVVALFEYGSTL
ncbi:MAG: hypothetical protein KAY59_05095 [Acidobacteria bacterium]|nr:hypothetical protein [Acidobacteriota bacterium]